jgi:chromosome segregation ATPase
VLLVGSFVLFFYVPLIFRKAYKAAKCIEIWGDKMGVLLAKKPVCDTAEECYKKRISELERKLMEKDEIIQCLREHWYRRIMDERAEHERELEKLKKELEKEAEKLNEYEEIIKKYAEFIVEKGLDSEFVEFIIKTAEAEKEDELRKKYMLPEDEDEYYEEYEEEIEDYGVIDKIKKAVKKIAKIVLHSN